VETGQWVGELALFPHLVERIPVHATVAGLIGAVRKQSAVIEGDEILWLFHQIRTQDH
jgi:hypothetical protein